jgi:class 3 adenylate cyclase
MVGQVSSGGRLEVTALGDQMNECARIQSAAKNGTILASKELIERLDSDDALTTGVDADTIAYTPVAELASARREGDPRRRIDPGRRCVSRS